MVQINKIMSMFIFYIGSWWLVNLVTIISLCLNPLRDILSKKQFEHMLVQNPTCLVYPMGWFGWSNSWTFQFMWLIGHIWLNLFYVVISLCGFFQIPILFDGSIFFGVTSQQKQELRAYWSMMAKRSYKRAARSEKKNAGCMWGLISMFDFRRGHSSQKLLSDKKHGSGGHVGKIFSLVVMLIQCLVSIFKFCRGQ